MFETNPWKDCLAGTKLCCSPLSVRISLKSLIFCWVGETFWHCLYIEFNISSSSALFQFILVNNDADADADADADDDDAKDDADHELAMLPVL